MTPNFLSRIVTLLFIACHLSLFSCGNRNPNLSEKQLQALLNDLPQKAETPLFALPDSNYVPPAGALHTEIRSVNPAAPPEIIDIAGNLENRKEFKLSDIASSVRYTLLQQPPDTKLSRIASIVSDDEHIFINTLQGLFCYSTEGQYLYTVIKSQHEEDGRETRLNTGTNPLSNIDLLNGKLVAQIMDKGFQLSFFDVREMDSQMFLNNPSDELRNFGIKPQYQRWLSRNGRNISDQYFLMDDQSIFNTNLTINSINGDTLCKLNHYDQLAVNRVLQGMGSRVTSNIYRSHGQIMLQTAYNDTVFRVTPPNRLSPVYVMNWGVYKPDISERFARNNDLEGKLLLKKWVETSRFIFLHYTEGRDNPSRRDQGKVTDCWAIYNKTVKTLTHHATSDASALIENDIDPVGMPFWPEGINHKGEMYMIFSKESIKRMIESGVNRNEKLQAISDNMTDDEVCIMTVK